MLHRSFIVTRGLPDAQGFVSDLKQQEWTFYFFEDTAYLALDSYRVLERKSRRHKWQAEGDIYERIHGSRSAYRSMAEKDVPMPRDVLEEAKREFFKIVRIGLWSDRYAKA